MQTFLFVTLMLSVNVPSVSLLSIIFVAEIYFIALKKSTYFYFMNPFFYFLSFSKVNLECKVAFFFPSIYGEAHSPLFHKNNEIYFPRTIFLFLK